MYTDAHGRPEIIADPLFKAGPAIPRVVRSPGPGVDGDAIADRNAGEDWERRRRN